MEGLLVTRRDRVLDLCIDREEKRNSLTSAALAAIADAVGPAAGDARVVLLRSTGTRFFSSGGDLGDISGDLPLEEAHARRGLFADTIRALRSAPVPVVCAVQGLCLAGGVGLALACDLVVASEDAEFGLPELGVGLWPFYVSALLAQHVSPKRAMDLMLTGERIPAALARDWGLVSRVLPEEGFAAGVDALVDRIATAPRTALALGKRTLNSVVDQDLDRTLLLMQSHLSILSASDEARAAMKAFLERRR